MSRKQKRNLAENGPRIVGADSKGFWPNWADRVQRCPWLSGRRGPGHRRGHRPALLLPPARLGRPGKRPGRDPDPDGLRHAGARVSAPGSTAPCSWSPSSNPTSTPSSTTSCHAVDSSPTWPSVADPIFIPSKTGSGDVVLVNVYPKTAPQAAATTDLVNHLRADTIPAGRRRFGRERPRRRHDRHLRRLRQRALRQAAALHRPGRPAVVPAADDRLPQPRDPAHRRGHEPALHRRGVRHAGGGLPMGRRRHAHRPTAPARSRPSCR